MSGSALTTDGKGPVSPQEFLDVVRAVTTEVRSRTAGSCEVSLDSSFVRDLGLDSLGRVEVLARLERELGVVLGEEVLATAESPRDLLQAALATGARLTEPTHSLPGLEVGRAHGRPDSALTLVEALDWHVERHPDRVHLLLCDDDGSTSEVTYGRLRSAAAAVAAGLLDRGLRPGDTIALMQPTGLDYFLSLYGALLAGCVPVPLYPPARPAQLEDHLTRQASILANARARLLVTVEAAKAVARLVAPRAPDLEAVVTVDDLRIEGTDPVRVGRTSDDMALLQYTSGSTGSPKGVVLTHKNLLANVRAGGGAIAADSKDVFVSWLPLYHDMGLIGACFGSLYFAMPLVLMSPLTFLARPQRWLWAIHNHRGTVTAAPNFAYELCLHRVDDQDIDGLDLSSCRVSFNGAEPISPTTVAAFTSRFSRYGFRPETMFPVYGLAESSVALAFPPLDRPPIVDRVRRDQLMRNGRAVPAADDDASALSFVSCGAPIAGHELRIVDAAGSEVGERREGGLQFRGPSATSGYFRNPEDSRRLFRGDWLDSGDRAYVAAGEVYLTGRAKDVIIRAGRNIYPHELEEVVGNVEGVRKGCVVVFGSADPASGTERMVVVAETRATEEEAHAAISRRITSEMADLVGLPPDEVVVAPPHTVLKTSSGKIRRAACRHLYEEGRLGAARRAPWLQLLRVAAGTIGPGLRRTARAVTELVYGAYVWTVTLLTAVVLWVAVALVPGFRRRWRVVARGMRALGWLTATPIRVDGVGNLPASGPWVLAANHASYIDVFLLVAVLDEPLVYAAKSEFRSSWITRVPLQRLGAVFVERQDAERGAEDTRTLLTALRSGHCLGFFPEGTFGRSPGLLPFRLGAFVAAAQAGVPVVPIVLRGTRSKLRAKQWRPRRGGVSLRVLPTVTPRGSEWSDAVALRDEVRNHILRHCGEPDRGGELQVES